MGRRVRRLREKLPDEASEVMHCVTFLLLMQRLGLGCYFLADTLQRKRRRKCSGLPEGLRQPG